VPLIQLYSAAVCLPMSDSLNIVWVILCAILVSTMQAGFCCLESGLVRAKNSINVAIKNLVDFCISCCIFGFVGFHLMFGESLGGVLGTVIPDSSTWSGHDYAFFLFQLTFCGTATTIVSGAVAERMTFLGYFMTSVIVSLVIYPVTGHWAWGGFWFDHPPGWLCRLQFHDFAGSTVVHSVGAWMALAAILIIGPRLGQFRPGSRGIEGHNQPIAVLGVFLLWFGWFGFNGGSTLAFSDEVPRILVITAQGGATGGLAALLTTWILDKRPKVPLVMNGVVGGLVAITAGCDVMLPLGGAITGAIGGVLCTLATRQMEYYKIDDAVGVVPAHLVCGIWGTLAVALFSEPSLWAPEYSFWQKLGVQSLGIGAVGLYAFPISYGSLRLANRIYPLRVTPEQEQMGLNIAEHGASTATQDLITSMNLHYMMGDFTKPVVVEPETDVSPIADHYNLVLKKMNQIKTELQTSRERLLQILNSPAFPVVISTVVQGHILFINERAAELFGFTLQEAGSYKEAEFWDNFSDREQFFRQVQIKGRVANFEAGLRRVDHSVFWSLISGLALTYANQSCVLLSFSDISAQIEREYTLRHLASTDPLTGVYNRRYFFDLAEKAVNQLDLHHQPFSILMLDIDHFKEINDQFGHASGDEAIQQVAAICSKILRDDDILGRLGGEEFALLLVDATLTAASSVAERLRQRVADTKMPVQSDYIRMTISIGVAEALVGESVDGVLRRADKALYQAKSKGRNRVELFDAHA
jgi:Amt family ammonium transporter